MSWANLENGNQELATFGAQRLAGRVSYLATVRKDGSPRVHPVTPIIGEGRLFVFMEPTSPKGYDLRRDGRYALHAGVEDDEGGQGEFFVAGRGRLVTDPVLRTIAVTHATYQPQDRYILFELSVEGAMATTYAADGPVRRRWEGERGDSAPSL